MNHIIFGGSGFIGTHLAKYIATIEPTSKIFKFDITKKVSGDFEYLDVRKPIELNIPDLSDSIIYNLAAVHTTPGHPDNEYFETNIWGAENVCAFAEKHGITTIVFTSSIAPYGPSEEIKEETTLPMPNSPYGISKLTAEYIHQAWQLNGKIDRKLVIVRPGVVFGQFEGGNFTRLYNSLRKKMFFYPGRKNTIKAAVYVKDVARILYTAAQMFAPGFDTYNLTYYPAPTIEDICLTIADVTGVDKPKVVVSSGMLSLVAKTFYNTGRLMGKKFNGIHPDRVKKLMISTNISGKKLSESPYHLKYTLHEAVRDWFADCDKEALY